MHRLVASFFGSGLILRLIRGSDSGSGTIGALVALPFSLWIGSSSLGWQGQLIGAGLLIIAALWSTRTLVSEHGDAGWIVIDEASGAFVASIGLAGWPAVIGFLVFRAADIFKSRLTGVLQAERLPGASGIIADDVVAGVYGLAIGHLVAQTLF